MGMTRNEALDCFRSDDLIGIGMEANAVRRHLHPEGVVSYAIDGTVTYTDTDIEQILNKIAPIVAMGGTGITLQGEVSPAHTISWFETLFRSIKQRFPDLWLHALSASEILTIAHHSGLTAQDTIARLHDAGLDSIPGNDAGILDDDVQHHNSRPHAKTSDWISVHRTAHRLGIQTTATMIFGGGETLEHRVNHLESVRQLQQETGGFTAFTPWTFAPQSSALQGFEEATAVEYLKTLAISRLYLDNIQNFQTHLETQGLKVLQVGLRFGANDAGRVTPAKSANGATEEQMRQIIRDAGFKPVQRDTLYRKMFLN
jgi:cyclic dehypoxanthinyl futalosine synthase